MISTVDFEPLRHHIYTTLNDLRAISFPHEVCRNSCVITNRIHHASVLTFDYLIRNLMHNIKGRRFVGPAAIQSKDLAPDRHSL